MGTRKRDWCRYALVWHLYLNRLWFQMFGSLKQVVVSCLRRSLTYPLYRHWGLSVLVLQDTVQIIALGEQIFHLLDNASNSQLRTEYWSQICSLYCFPRWLRVVCDNNVISKRWPIIISSWGQSSICKKSSTHQYVITQRWLQRPFGAIIHNCFVHELFQFCFVYEFRFLRL